MQVIYKYPLDDSAFVQKVSAPVIKPLRVDYRDGKPYFWAVVDNERDPFDVVIVRMATGQGFANHHTVGEYLNTTVEASKPFVWHWFYRMPEK